MNIYPLNSNFDRITLIENFESFIWTERYNDCGDFELYVPLSVYNNETFRPGLYLELDRSERLMIVKTVEKTKNNLDRDTIKITGESFESVFKERATVMNVAGTPYRTHNSPGVLMRTLVSAICVDSGGFSPSDIIPNLVVSNSDASSPGSSTHVEIPVESLHKSIKELADSDGFGFRILFDRPSKRLTFKAYKGTDRSRGNSSHPLVFSREYGNIYNTKFLRSIENYKTSAYVVHEDRSRVIVVGRSGRSSGSGMNRRVLVVDANDIESPDAEQLRQRGIEALTNYNYTSFYDGELRLGDATQYGVDYNMGDIVELVSEDDHTTRAIVVEHIWTYDHNGLRSYPTLAREEDF